MRNKAAVVIAVIGLLAASGAFMLGMVTGANNATVSVVRDVPSWSGSSGGTSAAGNTSSPTPSSGGSSASGSSRPSTGSSSGNVSNELCFRDTAPDQFSELHVETKLKACQVVGMTKQAAIDYLEGSDITVRIAFEDGEYFALTEDYRDDRVNLEILVGIVVGATAW